MSHLAFLRRLVGVLCLIGLASVAFSPAQHPEEAQRFQSAERHFGKREFKKAAREYRKVVKASPGEPLARYGLVRALIRLNKIEEAKSTAEAAVQALPESATAWTALADVHYRLARFENAASLYRRALLKDPNEARALLGLGKILAGEGKGRSARKQFQEAFRLDPDDPDIVRAWARVLEESEEEFALWEKFVSTATYEEPSVVQQIRSWLDLRESLGKPTPCHVEGDPVAEPVPLHPVYIPLDPYTGSVNQVGRYEIPVRFDGEDALRLELDTGASGLTLRRGAAKRAGLREISKTVVRGVGGKGFRHAGFALAESVRIGSLTFKDCLVTLVGNESLGPDGLVGSDLFADFLVTLDFKAQQVSFKRLPPLPEPENAEEMRFIPAYRFDQRVDSSQHEFMPVRRFQSHLLLETVVNKKARGYFLIDSGASQSSIALRLARALGKPYRSRWRVMGIGGEVHEVYQLPEVVLDFGPLRQANLGIISFEYTDLNENFGIELSGIMGITVLQQLSLTIDYRSFAVRFQP